MSYDKDTVDAKNSFRYIIEHDHVWGAGSKAKGASPSLAGSFGRCIQENAILAMPGVISCKFHKTVAFVRFVRNPKVVERFTPSQDGQKVAEINDRYGKTGLLKKLKFPMEMWLLKPRRNRSLAYLRSDVMKEVRAVSRERAIDRESDGEPARPYTKPESLGFRSATGSSSSTGI